jgi:hypothetical protein
VGGADPVRASDTHADAQSAREAQGHLRPLPEGKTMAAAIDNEGNVHRTASGIEEGRKTGPDFQGVQHVPVEDVRRVSDEIGHQPAPHFLDRGNPGSYNLCHAEKQMAVLSPGTPMAVSQHSCGDCEKFIQKHAQHYGETYTVRDPVARNSDTFRTRTFHPDGRITTEEADD